MKKLLLAGCLSLLSLTAFAQDSEQGDGAMTNPQMQQMQSMHAGMMMMGEMMRGAMPDRQMQQCQESDTECRMNQMQMQQRMMGQRMGMMQQMMQQMMEQMMQQNMQQQAPDGGTAENHEEHH